MYENLENQFQDKVKEIDRFYNLIKYIEEGASLHYNDKYVRIETGTTSTLKSSFILTLYNLVEATVTSCLQVIHSKIIEENILYFELNNSLQKLLLNYNYKTINKNTDKGIENLHILITTVVKDKAISDKLIADIQFLYSGNLDAKKIRNIAKKYDIPFDKYSDSLEAIKNMRNKLAHGEVSFEEGGRDKTIDYIQKLKDNTVEFMREFIHSVQQYINNARYKI